MKFEDLKKNIEKGKIEPQMCGVDFKSSWSRSHGKDISAIANDESLTNGWIVIGVDDKGKPLGKDTTWLKKEEELVSGHIHQYLAPVWAVKRIFGDEVNGSQCLFVEIVSPQDIVKWDGEAYHLVGTVSTKMAPHEVMELSLRLPGADFSKGKYSGKTDAAKIIEFARKVYSGPQKLDNIYPFN